MKNKNKIGPVSVYQEVDFILKEAVTSGLIDLDLEWVTEVLNTCRKVLFSSVGQF